MHLTILTGASRGLGLALAQQLLASGHQVLAISRRATELPAPAGQLICWNADLADATVTADRLEAWLDEHRTAPPSSLTLINNAGVVSQLAPLAHVAAADLSQALRLGLEAPMLLSAAFLRATAAWRRSSGTGPGAVTRKVLLISSGLGRRAMAGSASYCAAKAGLDHLARALALEEAAQPHGAKVVSLAPGVIDTDMQQQLRDADATLFPERKVFQALHDHGQLDSPAQAATKVLRYLNRADFGSQPVADVRDA